MMPLITVGPLRLSTYGLVLIAMAGIWWWWSDLRIRRMTGIDADLLLGVMLVGAWLGGRLWYVAGSDAIVAQLQNYRSLEFAWPGAILGALIILVVVTVRQSQPTMQVLSALALPTLVAQMGGAVGMYLAGIGMGVPWQGIWAIELAGTFRHPVQLYEAVIAVLGAMVCMLLQRRNYAVGHVVLLASVATNWLVVEGFRAQALYLPGGIHVAQVIGLVLLVIACEYGIHMNSVHSRAHTP